jgi:hypothetical protein
MELHVLAGMNENNSKQMESLLEQYRKMMFPGMEEDKSAADKELERARKLLAEEAGKVLLVRPIQPGEALPGNLPEQLKPLAGKAVAEMEKERLKELQSRRRRGKKAGQRTRRPGR